MGKCFMFCARTHKSKQKHLRAIVDNKACIFEKKGPSQNWAATDPLFLKTNEPQPSKMGRKVEIFTLLAFFVSDFPKCSRLPSILNKLYFFLLQTPSHG